ncbi:MAG: hypothetical protein IT462_02560 [Planctomycetes bacterium]|nr:hypothetical protein [Planctomycetota bacterium]
MFELNLIKDKAKARQRRRIIVLSVISIVFLAALCSVFVGLMTAQEKTRTDLQQATAQKYDKEFSTLKGRLDNEYPKAQDRKKAMKLAWDEDVKLLNERVFLSPVLTQIAQYKPARGQFWYSEISVTLMSTPTTGGAQPASPLLANRELSGTGVVQIVDSDIVTQQALEAVGRQISENPDVTRAVGVPTYELTFDEQAGGRLAGSAGRYARFVVRARRDFGGGGTER